MSLISFSLEDQTPDFRATECALSFTITNGGAEPIEILEISPSLPEGVSLSQTRAPDQFALREKHRQICDELSSLIADSLTLTEASMRKRLLDIDREHMKTLVSEISGFFGLLQLYGQLLSGQWQRRMEVWRRKRNALKVEIENSFNAKAVVPLIGDIGVGSDVFQKVLDHKILALERIEQRLQLDPNEDKPALALIEAGDQFQSTYIVRFGRNLVNSSKFLVNVHVKFRQRGGPENPSIQNGVAAAAIDISPNPVILTIVAVFGGAIGWLMKIIFTPRAAEAGEAFHRPYPAELFMMLMQPDAIGVMILSLIVFNVFEFTDLFKDFRKRLGWRAALFVGAICGLGSERIFSAFQALIGK